MADLGATRAIRHHGEVTTTRVALDRLIRRIAMSKNIPRPRIVLCNVSHIHHWEAGAKVNHGVGCLSRSAPAASHSSMLLPSGS